MFCRFLIPLRPMSVNKMYRSYRGRMIKSQEAREFEIAFNHYLAEFADQAVMFMQSFDRKAHTFNIEYVFYLNKERFFTKNGRINQRCCDVDNAIKQSQDCLFSFLNIDDAYVTRLAAAKVASESDCIEIVVRRSNLVTKILSPEPRANLGSSSIQ